MMFTVSCCNFVTFSKLWSDNVYRGVVYVLMYVDLISL